MDVSFACPVCERPARVGVDRPTDWQCAGCEHRLHLPAATTALPVCVVCGNGELFKKKDFPHWLGMSILVGACVASVLTYGYYEKWLTWAILLGSAAFDGLLYLWVGDAVVCYRCEAQYRHLTATDAHAPFELSVGERYRQEKLRREQVRRATSTTPQP